MLRRMAPIVKPFFHESSHTLTYVVHDSDESKHCVIIDPALDYDPKSGVTGTAFSEKVWGYIQEKQLNVDWILETHVHADHITSAPFFKERTGAPVCVGERVVEVQKQFKELFNFDDSVIVADGSQFDRLLKDGDELELGSEKIAVMATPGHTPACTTYVIGDAIFVGDTLFMPDSGTARCDFPGGCSKQMYQSLQKILSLPETHRMFICHDYCPGGRELRWETTVAEQRQANIHVREGISEEEYVDVRDTRDGKLAVPVLLLPSVQVNIMGGKFPPAEDNGTVYLKIPINKL